MGSALLWQSGLPPSWKPMTREMGKGHGGNLLLVERTSRSGNADGQSRAESKDWDESTTRVDGGTYKKRTHCQHSNRARVVEVQPGQPGLLGLSRYSMAVF